MSPDVVSAIADCCIALFTLLTVGIAFVGLRTWRNQLHGTNEYQLAKKILLDVYRLREALNFVRYPFMSSSEADPVQKDIPWEVSAYERRWAAVGEVYAELNVSLLEARVVWEGMLGDAESELDERKFELKMAVESFIKAKQDKTYRATNDYKKTLYSTGSKDEYMVALNTAIAKFEDKLKPFVVRRKFGFRKSFEVLIGRNLGSRF